jgi:NTP pyrophosphatase (non-canonical NTP hydrolase)
MHILKRNDNLKIDNETITFKEITNKLKEEFYEVIKAINNYNHNKTLLNLKEIIRETFDVIQICILILWRCNRAAKDFDYDGLIEEINIEHKDKLISERGWIIETGIQIDVKE